MEPWLDTAHQLAEEYHACQVDKAGNPYIEHLEYVSSHVDGIEAKTVALLHDILEDTTCTPEILLDAGFDKTIVEAVISMTHKQNETYDTYIRRVSKNPIASIVKLADMKHNSDLSRLQTVTQRDLARKEKYTYYINLLESCTSH